MALSLFDINANIESLYARAVDPETGEVLDEELFRLLDQCEVEREERILYLADRIKSQRAEAAAYRNEARKLTERAQQVENSASRDERYIDENLEDGEQLKNDHSEVKRRKTPPKVKIDIMWKVPVGYRVQPEWTPDLRAIKDALKEDESIDWARLQSRSVLQIR